MSLREGSRFGSMYRTGSRIRRGGLVVLEGDGLHDMPEAGFVAGKKVGNAVQRNRAKRRMRAAADMCSLRSSRAYVFVASREVAEVAFDDLVEWMNKAVEYGTAGDEA